MKTEPAPLEFTEPERYELREGPFYHFELSRRDFIQTLGAGIVIAVVIPNSSAQRARNDSPIPLAQRLHIAANGTITVLTSKVEFGQGSRTQLTQAAAEELALHPDRIQLLMADSALVPDDGGTAGSRTTPSTVPAVRRACASARQLLIEAAAAQFNADPKNLSVRNGQVVGLSPGQTFSYAQFAGDPAKALQRTPSAEVTLTPVKEWRVLGLPTPKTGGRSIVTGAHQYPSDIRRPGMLYGKILRPPAYNSQLTTIDLAPARALPGVVAVHDGDFVGFAAPNSFLAESARDAAAKTAQWKSNPHPSSDELYAQLRNSASPDQSRRDQRGSPQDVFAKNPKVFRQTYHAAYIQHAPMEPRAAVAEWTDGNLTVWTGTQQPSRVRDELSRALRLPPEKVRLIVPDTGGGFGGKHSGETAVEAARLALEAKRPVAVHWSREEEFTWAYFRPAGVIDLAAALDDSGKLIAWEHVNFNSGASAIASPYDIPNTATHFRNTSAPLRAGSYRALASTANTFARESFMDELAAAFGADPLAFRLAHLKNDRLRAVLIAATNQFHWKSAWKKHTRFHPTGVGLACGIEKGSYVACCVKVEVDETSPAFKVLHLCEAFECGAIQNPANLKAQVEGCIIQGLGGALHEEIRFKNGKILNPRFSQYHVPRFRDVPPIETVLVNRPDLPSAGAGETPIIAIAPAIANALFNATQTRLRSLPLVRPL